MVTVETLKKEVNELKRNRNIKTENFGDGVIQIDGEPVSLAEGVQKLIEISRGYEK